MMESGADPPRPRMCYLYKVEDFDGYGFNLCKIKGREGQFIGNIELGSPADRGGLREGDRLVEVNGENIETKSHKKVVKRIKEIKGEVSLLLVDSVCDNYLKKEKIKLSGKYSDVVVIHSSKGEELLDDVDVNQFENTEVQSITLKIEDLQEEDETDEPILDVVTVSFGDKSGEEATVEKTDEPLMDVVTVTFGDKSGEEKTDEPIIDVVTVSFGDKTGDGAIAEKTDEPIMDVVTVSFNDESDEVATAEETDHAIQDATLTANVMLTAKKTDDLFLDVVTVSFGDKSGEEATVDKSDEPIMDVVTVSFGEKSGEGETAEKTDEPILDVVKVSFGDKSNEEAIADETDEPIIDVVTVSFGDKSGEEATAEETDEPIQDATLTANVMLTAKKTDEPFHVVTVTFGDKSDEEATVEVCEESKANVTLVSWGQEDVEKVDITNVDGDQERISNKVKEDWKLTRDELDADESFEKDDLPKSVSTSSIHSLTEERPGSTEPLGSVSEPARNADSDNVTDPDEGSETRERGGGLELPRTAQEMRDMIQQRRRRDPRTDNNIDMWQKHSIVQAL